MTAEVRISDDMLKEARKLSKINQRSVSGQIEHWAGIGKCAEENPDLTYDLIKELLVGIEALDQGDKSPYIFD